MSRSASFKTTLALPVQGTPLPDGSRAPLRKVVHDSNIIIAQAHLQDLLKRTKAALAVIQVPVLRRIRFDGVTFPNDLEEYFWLKPNVGYDGKFCSPALAHPQYNIVPPLGLRRWVYFKEEGKPASKVVPVEIAISPEQVITVFEYWKHQSIMVNDNMAKTIEESRPSGRRHVRNG